MFLSTVQQLKSIPILFESLPILEEVRDGSIMSVDDSWKTGKENWEGIPTHCSDNLVALFHATTLSRGVLGNKASEEKPSVAGPSRTGSCGTCE